MAVNGIVNFVDFVKFDDLDRPSARSILPSEIHTGNGAELFHDLSLLLLSFTSSFFPSYSLSLSLYFVNGNVKQTVIGQESNTSESGDSCFLVGRLQLSSLFAAAIFVFLLQQIK